MKEILDNLKSGKQEILTGSSKIYSKNKNNYFDKNKYFLENMHLNKAYLSYIENNSIEDVDNEILYKFKRRFLNYRNSWSEQPKMFFSNGIEKFDEQIKFSKYVNKC